MLKLVSKWPVWSRCLVSLLRVTSWPSAARTKFDPAWRSFQRRHREVGESSHMSEQDVATKGYRPEPGELLGLYEYFRRESS